MILLFKSGRSHMKCRRICRAQSEPRHELRQLGHGVRSASMRTTWCLASPNPPSAAGCNSRRLIALKTSALVFATESHPASLSIVDHPVVTKEIASHERVIRLTTCLKMHARKPAVQSPVKLRQKNLYRVVCPLRTSRQLPSEPDGQQLADAVRQPGSIQCN